MTTVSSERLAAIFVEMADTLVDEFDVFDFLQTLTERASSLVGGAAVGLMLADQRGRLEFVAGSTESVRLVELFQLQNQEGPCLDAFHSGEPVVNVDLSGDDPGWWPLFTPRATAAGFLSVHAFPLRLRQQVIGAMNVFGNSRGELTPADVPVFQALADVATIGLLQERAIRRAEELTEQLQGALNSRIVIEQAKGAIAQVRGISVDEAFAFLRSYARHHNFRIVDLAHTIVTDLDSLPDLRGAG